MAKNFPGPGYNSQGPVPLSFGGQQHIFQSAQTGPGRPNVAPPSAGRNPGGNINNPFTGDHNTNAVVGQLIQVNNKLQMLIRMGSPGGGAGSGSAGTFGGMGGRLGAMGRLGRFMYGGGHIGGGVSQIANALKTGNVGRAAFGLANISRGMSSLGVGGGGAAAGGAASTVAAAAAPGILMTAAVVAFTIAMKEAADSLIEFNREMAKVSPSMAMVYQQRDIQEMFRERKRGEMLAESTGNLTREEQRYKDAIFPIEAAWQELKGNILAGFYSTLADIAENVNEIAEIAGITSKKNDQNAALASFSGIVNKIADDADKKRNAAMDKARGAR